MLVSALAPLLTAGFAAAFVLPESLRLNKIDIDSFYPESLKDVASAVENVEHIVHALTHPFTPEPEDKTVYELIAANPEFSKLLKVIDFAGEPIIDLLNSTDANFTVFAVPNSGLRFPGDEDLTAGLMSGDTEYDLVDISNAVEVLEAQDDDDDDKKKEKREFFKKLAQAVLLYHVVPERAFTSSELAVNTTFATKLSLPDDSFKGEPLRVRVASTPPFSTLVVNFYAKVIKGNVYASNGIVHVINHPLFPPPSIFQELFQLPATFSIVSTALQRTNLHNFVEWRYVPSEDKDGEGSVKGNPAVTFFAPDHSAFKRLPTKLALFLFSPFGEHVLKKILAYHIVPNYVLHTDYAFNVTTGEEVIFGPPKDSEDTTNWTQFLYPASESSSSSHPHPHHPPTYYSFNIHPGTILGSNHTLDISVTKRVLKSPLPGHGHPDTYLTHFEVDGERVVVSDGPARNGAVHAIGKVLDPRGRKHGHHGHDAVSEQEEYNWEDWEEWLPAWAAGVEI